jgi:tetratricopeptide (TPR) repeat protein
MNHKTNHFVTLPLLFLSFFFYSFTAAQENLIEIVKKISPSVVLVLTYDEQGKALSLGSGFFINAPGEVITNFHVLAKASRAEIKTSSGNVYPVKEVLAEDKINDLIRVSVDMPKQKATPLSPSSSVPQVGEKIAVVGNPLGLEQTVSDGIVSAVRDIPGFGKIIQITAPISPGSSGSPVVNMKGEVIGIATLQITEGQNLNFAIPGEQIAKLTPTKAINFSNWEKGRPGKGVSSAEDIFLTGLEFFKAGEYEKSLPYFERAVKQDPKDYVAYLGIGLCNFELGRYNEAIEAYKQAIHLKPDISEAHNNLSVAYGKLDRHQEEVEAVKEAIRLKPDNAEAYFNLGAVYARLGRHRESGEAFKQLTRLQPDDAEAHYGLGTAYANLGRYQEAIEAFKKAIRIKPDDAKAHFGLGLTYSLLDDKGAALKEYKILKNIDKEKADKLFNVIYK